MFAITYVGMQWTPNRLTPRRWLQAEGGQRRRFRPAEFEHHSAQQLHRAVPAGGEPLPGAGLHRQGGQLQETG